MKIRQNPLNFIETLMDLEKGFKAKMVIKPPVTGEPSIYVNQHFLETSVSKKQDARMGPVLDNPLVTLPRSPLSLRENGLK